MKRMAVEHQERYCGYRGPHEGVRGPSLTQGFPQPGFQSQKEFLQNLTGKISRDINNMGEMEGI